MTAICPAGPPKVWSEIANQALVASRSGTTSRLSVLTASILAWRGAAAMNGLEEPGNL